jgi:hypothetical protein
MARGEIVAWLNSDDILLPGAVSRAVQAFQRAPEASVIYGEGYLMDRGGNLTRRFPATEPFNLWKLVYLSDYILQQSVFFRRAAVEETFPNISARCASTRRPKPSPEAGAAWRRSGVFWSATPGSSALPVIGSTRWRPGSVWRRTVCAAGRRAGCAPRRRCWAPARGCPHPSRSC